MSVLTQVLVAILGLVWDKLQSRQDLINLTRAQDLAVLAKVDAAALNWLVAAQRDPARWATLNSLPGGSRLTGQFTPDADPPGPDQDRPVQP